MSRRKHCGCCNSCGCNSCGCNSCGYNGCNNGCGQMMPYNNCGGFGFNNPLLWILLLNNNNCRY